MERKKQRDELLIKLALDKTKSLATLGKQFNISRQRISQILKRAGIKKEFIFRGKCMICNKEFLIHYTGERFCSDKCQEEYNKEYYNKRSKKRNWKRKEELIKKFGNKCAICGKEEVKLVIDHNHKTKKIRGLLCEKCNTGLGFFYDNPELFKKAEEYLKVN